MSLPILPAGLGFGGSGIGNLGRSVDDLVARRAIEAAWSLGVRFFDTAPHYGLGLSERRLGAVLRGMPRDTFVLSTKVGRNLVTRRPPADVDDEGFVVPGDLARRWDFSVGGIAACLRASCERLGLDRMDLALVHDADRAWDGAARSGLRALAALRTAGEVAAIGIGTTSVAGLAELVEAPDPGAGPDVVMLAGRYTLLDHRDAIDVLDAAHRRGIEVVLAGVFNSGVLATPRPVPGATYEYRPANEAIFAAAGRLADVCAAHGVDLPTAAIAFARRHPAVRCVVVGMASEREVEENVARHATPVPDALWTDLVGLGLIDARCARR